jgi:hypothetical protein
MWDAVRPFHTLKLGLDRELVLPQETLFRDPRVSHPWS